MKNISFAVTAGAALVILGAGCYQTRIERQSLSPEEQAWENIIRESYPGYKAPPKTSRSVKGHTESRVSAVIRETPVKAMDDPVDPVQPVQPQSDPVQIAPAAEEKADKPVIPADPATPPVVEVKADAPAEKPADAPAPAEKPAEPAEKPADAPAPAEKPAASAEKPAAPAADQKAVAPAGNMPPDPTNSTVYVVKSGDTLGSIAQKNYGNARYSNVIFKANSDILKNPNKLRPGMKLIIPKL